MTSVSYKSFWLHMFGIDSVSNNRFHGQSKYVVLAPWLAKSIYDFVTTDPNKRDTTSILIVPLMLTRMLNNQIWISLSRYKTAKGKNRIVDKTIEFEQVDRERDWFVSFLLYFINLHV